MLGTPHSSSRAWMNSASAWLRPPATRTSSPSVSVGSILRQRPCASLSGSSSDPLWRRSSSGVDNLQPLLLHLPVRDTPQPDDRLVLERHDQVAPVRIGGQVDVRLRRLGGAARVRVVDPHVEALVVELVGGEEALVVELVAVRRLARVL